MYSALLAVKISIINCAQDANPKKSAIFLHICRGLHGKLHAVVDL
jgi:hypothetical protein